MIQLVCLNGEVFADHDGNVDVDLLLRQDYPAGCTVVPWTRSLGALDFVEPAPAPGEPDLRRRRKAPVLSDADDLRAYAASLRYYRSRAGVTIAGVLYATDDATNDRITSKIPLFQVDPKATITWKAPGGFVTLDLAGFTAMMHAVTAFREACFAAEGKADAGIADGSVATMAAVEAIIAAAGA